MNPRITSIENLVASDPGGRNIFGLLVADQLRLAAQSLRLARRVGIVSGFFIKQAGAGETDGPPGAKVLGDALRRIGIPVDIITDERNAPLFRALELEPITEANGYLDKAKPTHLVAVERPGRGVDGRFRNMRGEDITDVTAPLDELFIEAARRGLTTIGIGDGGNEIGMGKVFADALAQIAHGPAIATTAATDFCIVAGVSNWGAFGLAGALSVLEGRDLLPTADDLATDVERLVREGGAVDGVTLRREPTIDGLEMPTTLRMLENIRRQLAPSPLERGEPLRVGVLGFGEAGQAASRLLLKHGHQVCISDEGPVTLPRGMVAAGVESGRHTIDFLGRCDLVVTSPGIHSDSSIVNALHRSGIPVISELELAYQVGIRSGSTASTSLIGVTGTVGKRSTVELLQQMFTFTKRQLIIGGNRGRPLSELLLDHNGSDPIALAVSSFQLETVVSFRPHLALLLNIKVAHLDRHRTLSEYIRTKSRVFMNHRPDDILILPFDDPRLRTLARKHHGRTFFVSTQQPVDRGAWLIDGVVRLNVDGPIEEIGPACTPFPENLLGSLLTARHYGLTTADLAQFVSKNFRQGAAT